MGDLKREGLPKADKVLWEEFDKETKEKARRDVVTGAITSSVLVTLFGILDYFEWPALFLTFIGIRLGCVAANMIILALTRTTFGEQQPYLLSVLEYVLAGLSIVLMVHLSGGYSSTYYAGINLVLLALIYVLPLTTKRAGLVCGILYLAYMVPILLYQKIDRLDILLNNNFFFLATIVLVILSSHLAGQIRYREFSARFSLARANEELKQLDILKSQFFANVSHEVRTPLTSILAPVQSLYQGDLGVLKEEQQEVVGQIYRNALKLLDMINQMLDFSKFEARKMQLRLKYIDLEELAGDIVTSFQEVAERKGLKMRFVAEDEVEAIYLDEERVERVITNLIRNAIKFTESGSITVRVGSDSGRRWVEIRDTGIGISQKHMATLFTRFQQVDSSSTRRYEGTGLGLTIVKESVDLMKGQISVQSEENRGTSFRVQLPDNLDQLAPDAFIEKRRLQVRRARSEQIGGRDRRREIRRTLDQIRITVDDITMIESHQMSGGAVEQRSAESEKGYKDTVLLVEDNVDLRTYVSKMLARFGHRVATAIDGLDGWEHVRAERPDLVVSDIMMPRMDGYELVNRIKSSEKTRQIPVILITAKPEIESKLEGLERGADDYLPKPINIRELDVRIKNLLMARNLNQALGREAELAAKMEELSMSFSQSLEIRDANTAGHSRDVLSLGKIIAEKIGMRIDRMLKDSLLLHDIGKLGIPDRILLKESPLNDDEWQIMKTHPALGAGLLGHFESYQDIGSIILAHQEHYDGTGYPKGLKGEEIPLVARIVGIADAYHAMTNNRPYRKAVGASQAVQELRRHAGTQFDAKLVEAFIAGLREHNILQEAS